MPHFFAVGNVFAHQSRPDTQTEVGGVQQGEEGSLALGIAGMDTLVHIMWALETEVPSLVLSSDPCGAPSHIPAVLLSALANDSGH